MERAYEVGIIGSGFGGIIAALELVKAGINSFVIFERAAEPGGTWRDNVYPGCACDVRSHLYSISSQQKPDWNSSFSGQAEIFQYLKDVVHNNNLQKHIRFNTNITEMQFMAGQGYWQVIDGANNNYHIKMMILATGPFNNPRIPEFAGMETFTGKKLHSFNWEPGIDMRGKKVAVIGTGASAIQIIPQIAPVADELIVFQRSPAWITSRRNRQITAFEKWLFKTLPFTQRLSREAIYWINEFIGLSFTGNDGINYAVKQSALKKLSKEVNDPAVRKKLTPKYKIGCKRVLVSDDFYPAFNRENVTLVTDGIKEISHDSIITETGNYAADVIVFATGFVTADICNYIKVTGLGGRVLTDEWDKTGAEALRGITVSGYPNMAAILGPNTGLGHSSVIHMMESQMRYIVQYIRQLKKIGETGYLDVKPEVQRNHNDELQAMFANTVWASGCKSFYLNKNGKNTTIYPRLTQRYRRETRVFNVLDFV